ncbi:DUF6519 domain-containing protein [Desulfobacter curvatus]|uniref:DUF6519 domain-containing protein n=1 Tax=Desulfobacter curvatus TaxID=2290 RepID=UPI0003763C0C|nr:DUF6519 domain-containing protein [Desulfobacter curvatus]
MKIQISRNSRQKGRHYSSVCHQQGRMLTDSDLTEQALIARDRVSEALRDVIGSGTPRHGGLVRITADGSPGLFWGRVYVDGVPAVVAADETADSESFNYASQLFYPQAPDLPDGDFRFYVDVWERSVIWLEDDMLRDPGLHGADTTARTQTMAQVKWCARDLDPLCEDINPTMGNARLGLVLRSLSAGADPCDPCADELELNEPVGNYLFRAEIHDVHYDENNRADWIILKWSSENGAEAYKTTDVPPDFSGSQYVYEYFDEVTEKRLGNHLARDGAGARSIDGLRPALENDFSSASPGAKTCVRRWDGWCRIEKEGSNWQVTQGFEGNLDLGRGIGSGNPGHVTQGGAAVAIELRMITLSLELGDLNMIAGDYWTVPVRESVHRQGDVLLQGDTAGTGALPEGEVHHYLTLVDVLDENVMVLAGDSSCDEYDPCRFVQFPSLTELRAEDICFDNQICSMPEAVTVQDALDTLCRQNDLSRHNKFLHGWGIVCGLALECSKKNPDSVVLQPGYALDCEGRDLILEKAATLNIPKLMEKAGINPEPASRDERMGLCLYIESSEEKKLDVGIEVLETQEQGWSEIFSDTLLMDFYQDCILDLINMFKLSMDEDDEVIARCTRTLCGKKLLPPARRRGLAVANLVFNDAAGGASNTVLNVSPCEHALIRDLYARLQDYLQSKTFCAQFEQNEFPDYPFNPKTACRCTWFTPEDLDHVRLHPDGRILFGWQRNSSRIFVFQYLNPVCMGDLIGYVDVPKVEDGTITDLAVSEKGMIHLSVILQKENTLFLRGQFAAPEDKKCEIKMDWETAFLAGRKIARIGLSPWSGKHLYAVALCDGVFFLELDKIFQDGKVGRNPDWIFPASGHIRFDKMSNQVLATAFSPVTDKDKDALSCAKGRYNAMAVFNASPSGEQPVPAMLHFYVNEKPASGSDGFDISPSTQVIGGSEFTIARGSIVTDLQTFVVIDENDKKILCAFDMGDIQYGENKQMNWFGEKRHSFGAAKKVDLSYISSKELDGVIASRFAMHDLQYIPSDPKLIKKGLLDSIPVQAGPVEVIVNSELEQVVILNHTGQSITIFNYDLPAYQKESKTLAAYRKEVISAFFSLSSGIAQYLKDCFCHHLLIRCPECDDDDKVYLGCLTLADDEVYEICNFTKRKYVKTFPAMSYWFSLLPVEGLVAWVVEKLCCLVMPDYISEKPETGLAVSPAAMTMTKSALHANPAMFASVLSSKGGEVVKKQVTQAIGFGLSNQTGFKDSLKNEYNYKPGVFVEEKTALITNERLLEKIDAVKQKEAATTDTVSDLKTQMAKLQQEKALVEERFAAVESAKQTSDAKVAELEKELVAVKAAAEISSKQVVELEKGVAEFQSLQEQIQPLLAGAKSVSTLSGISSADLKLLERNNIRTVAALATMDLERLVKIGISSETATGLIKTANTRIIG